MMLLFYVAGALALPTALRIARIRDMKKLIERANAK